MSVEEIRSFLGWCSVLNLGLVLYWFVFLVFAHDWVYRLHSRWFPMSEARFTEIHYSGMMVYKLSTFLLCVVPYGALWLVTRAA